MTEVELTTTIWTEIRAARGVDAVHVGVTGRGLLGSVFAVTELAAASVAAAGAALATLIGTAGGSAAEVRVDRALASQWFASSLRPLGWQIPSPWDLLAAYDAGLRGRAEMAGAARWDRSGPLL